MSMTNIAEPTDFAPCPLCKQYSHSIGEDQLADAFNHFQMMYSHRGDGIPTQDCFDEKTRDAAQVLMAAARSSAPQEPDDALRRENADLRHDLERQMTIANIECNEAEGLRGILRVVRPYISDRAGAGIIDAVNAAIQAKASLRLG